MHLSWLEDFLALASSGNFSRAADARHMTQPAFSRRIRALEEWLGVALFDRAAQPIALTDAGQGYVAVARDTLARVARMPEDARAAADARAATLRFACTHALSLTFLPAWLRGLEGRIAGQPIQVVSDVLAQCEDAILEQRSQFLVCHAHRDVPGRLDARCRSSIIGHETLLPVSRPGRGTRARHRLDEAAVSLLAYSAESGLGRIVRALGDPLLRKQDATVVFTAHTAAMLKSMALDGRGAAWLPENLIADELANGKLVAAAPPRWRIETEIRLYRADVAYPPAAEAFWSAIATA